MTHTAQQIADWKEFEAVRQGGRFNMCDPNARTLTGLERADYLYCIKHYDTLKVDALAEQP